MKFVLSLVMLCWAFSLTGCAWITSTAFPKDKEKPQLHARSVPPLKIPPGLSSDQFHAKYPIADTQYALNSADASVLPPGL